MPIVVTVDMYSGLPNPSWELTTSEAKKLLELLSKEREQSTTKSPATAGLLGYRGIIVTNVSEVDFPKESRVFDGLVETTTADTLSAIDRNSEIEQFLMGTAGLALSGDETTFIQEQMQKNSSGGTANSLRELRLDAVPPFNPAKWNNDTNIRLHNNCYNYANDKITNTFAQPGRGSGQEGTNPPSCAGTGAAAQRDGQRPIPNPDMTPAEGQVIALVISTTPGFLDYHWYRRDSNTLWSHKPGNTPARNTDNSGRLISDPRTCNRGPYNIFCGFYLCIPSQTRIR